MTTTMYGSFCGSLRSSRAATGSAGGGAVGSSNSGLSTGSPARLSGPPGTIPAGSSAEARAAYAKQYIRDKLLEHKQYVETHGEDLPEIRDWKWTGGTGRGDPNLPRGTVPSID